MPTAIVIGSGAGGSFAAMELATAGWQVYPKAVAGDLTDAFARLAAR